MIPTSSDSIRVVVADDHALVRAGLVALIEVEPDLCLVGEATDGVGAARAARDHQADVVLMDLSMPGSDGLAGLRQIRADDTDCAVVMLTTFDLDESIDEALRAGAAGYLLKAASADELPAAIRAARRGERVFSRTVQDRLVESYLDRRQVASEPPEQLRLLSERELEVFGELARGKSNPEIARALFLSESTVKTYVTRLLSKLGLRDRVQAVIFALQHGLVPDDQ